MDAFEGHRGDPVSLHKYVYGNANPVRFTDPSGHFSSLRELNFTAFAIATIAIIAVPTIYVVQQNDPVAIARSVGAVISDAVAVARRALRGSAIIGESSERVIWAKFNRYRLAEIFYPDTNDFPELKEANIAWIVSVMARGMIIIDIGIDPTRKVRGPFYVLEVAATAAYPAKIYDNTVPGFGDKNWRSK